jgi:hypothetical protein
MQTPVNSKSLFAFICDQMGKLDRKEISVEDAKAQANLSKQANNALKYELDRADMTIKIRDYNLKTGATIKIREIESKPFDDTINV